MPDGQSLEFSGVTKRFGAVTAVSDLSARVEPGRVTGFLGPNGAGKTTTLRILLGLVRASGGHATIGGQRYAELERPLQTVGAVLEASSFHPGRTAAAHLTIYAHAAGIAKGRVDEALALVGLADAAGRKVGGYSLGMRQRLGLAYALLGDPGVLVLDEPANGLDPEGIRWMRGFLRQLAAEGRTVLVSSHLLTEVQQTVDALLIISRGRLVFEGAIDDLADPSEYATVVDAPDRAALAAALESAGLPFEVLRSGLTVRGADPAAVGAIAASAGVALASLQRRGPALEEIFLDLVNGTRVQSADRDAAPAAVASATVTAARTAAAPEAEDPAVAVAVAAGAEAGSESAAGGAEEAAAGTVTAAGEAEADTADEATAAGEAEVDGAEEAAAGEAAAGTVATAGEAEADTADEATAAGEAEVDGAEEAAAGTVAAAGEAEADEAEVETVAFGEPEAAIDDEAEAEESALAAAELDAEATGAPGAAAALGAAAGAAWAEEHADEQLGAMPDGEPESLPEEPAVTTGAGFAVASTGVIDIVTPEDADPGIEATDDELSTGEPPDEDDDRPWENYVKTDADVDADAFFAAFDAGDAQQADPEDTLRLAGARSATGADVSDAEQTDPDPDPDPRSLSERGTSETKRPDDTDDPGPELAEHPDDTADTADPDPAAPETDEGPEDAASTRSPEHTDEGAER